MGKRLADDAADDAAIVRPGGRRGQASFPPGAGRYNGYWSSQTVQKFTAESGRVLKPFT